MVITCAYRRQHNEVTELMRAIEEKLDKAFIANGGANEVRDLLGTLTGKLMDHLAAEDKALYPKMKASKNVEIATISNHFQREMGGLKLGFVAYYGQWSRTKAIQSDPAGFIRATRDIFDALNTRIDRENTYLFHLADRP